MYVSIDIETTGLNRERHQVLEIGAVSWDNDDIHKCSTFEIIIDPSRGLVDGVYGKDIVGEPYALNMNKVLLGLISEGKGSQAGHASLLFRNWLHKFNDGSRTKFIDSIGVNFGAFDWQFLLRMPDFPSNLFGHRHTEVGTFRATKDGPVSVASAFDRISTDYDIKGEPHRALYDAKCALVLAMENIK